jgi:hypothetical protein
MAPYAWTPLDVATVEAGFMSLMARRYASFANYIHGQFPAPYTSPFPMGGWNPQQQQPHGYYPSHNPYSGGDNAASFGGAYGGHPDAFGSMLPPHEDDHDRTGGNLHPREPSARRQLYPHSSQRRGSTSYDQDAGPPPYEHPPPYPAANFGLQHPVLDDGDEAADLHPTTRHHRRPPSATNRYPGEVSGSQGTAPRVTTGSSSSQSPHTTALDPVGSRRGVSPTLYYYSKAPRSPPKPDGDRSTAPPPPPPPPPQQPMPVPKKPSWAAVVGGLNAAAAPYHRDPPLEPSPALPLPRSALRNHPVSDALPLPQQPHMLAPSDGTQSTFTTLSPTLSFGGPPSSTPDGTSTPQGNDDVVDAASAQLTRARVPSAACLVPPPGSYDFAIPHIATEVAGVSLLSEVDGEPHLRFGGVCCEAPIHAIAHAVESLTGVRLAAISLFRGIHGLAVARLRDPQREGPIVRRLLHQTAFMTPAAIYIIRRPAGASCETDVRDDKVDVEKLEPHMRAYELRRRVLDKFAGALPPGSRVPRRLMTCEPWVPAPAAARPGWRNGKSIASRPVPNRKGKKGRGGKS